jgi:hypothetical protein
VRDDDDALEADARALARDATDNILARATVAVRTSAARVVEWRRRFCPTRDGAPLR